MCASEIYNTIHRSMGILCGHLAALLHEIASELYGIQVAGLTIDVKERTGKVENSSKPITFV